MSDVKLDTQTFFKRAGKVFSAWEQPGQGTEELKDLVAIQVLMGEPDDEVVQYTKTSAMQVSRIVGQGVQAGRRTLRIGR